MTHKTIALELIREEIQSNQGIPSEDLLLAILRLAVSEVTAIPTEKESYSPFFPPLRSARWLNVYGNMTFVVPHILAVRKIVDMYGGLPNLKMLGLADSVSLSVISSGR